MDITIIISIIFSFACIIVGFLLEGGALGALYQFTALLIVVGGTIGAVGVAFPGKTLKRFPKVFSIAFKKKNSNLIENVEFFKKITVKTRKNGLLSLEVTEKICYF